VAGETNSFGAGGSDVFLIKTDSLGDTLWTRTYGGSGSDYASSVRQTADGGYVLAGITNSFGAGGVDFYLVKTDSLGDALWTRTCGGDNHDIAYSVWQTTDGGYIVAGWTMSFGASNHPDVMVARFDSMGNTCIGEFVSSTVMNVSPAVTSPATEIISPLTIVTTPPVTVTPSVTGINTICERVRGDANGDGIVDLGDIVYLVGYLYKGGPAPDPVEAGDCNCDGIVNLGDVVYLVSYLYKGGPPPGCP
jgi:hypothetical protein